MIGKMKWRVLMMTTKTRLSWILNIALLVSSILTTLSAIYFLFLPSGGYRGGRNPAYGVVILFDRNTWNILHTWAGTILVIVAVIHVVIHLDWFVAMIRRAFHGLSGRGAVMKSCAWRNLILNGLIGTAFLLAGVTGIYFLLGPVNGIRNARNVGLMADLSWIGLTDARDAYITMDLIHTWAGVVMIIAAAAHIVLHWRWIEKVTVRFFARRPQPGASSQLSSSS
jgi:hypothetical protein